MSARILPTSLAGGPSEQAGIKVGDVIEEWDGQEIHSKEEFHRQLESYSVGEHTEFKIRRVIPLPLLKGHLYPSLPWSFVGCTRHTPHTRMFAIHPSNF